MKNTTEQPLKRKWTDPIDNTLLIKFTTTCIIHVVGNFINKLIKKIGHVVGNFIRYKWVNLQRKLTLNGFI